MKIYIINHDLFDFDCNLGHIIVAYNESQVVQLARDNAAYEGKKIWVKKNVKQVGIYTGSEKEPFILLSDYNAG